MAKSNRSDEIPVSVDRKSSFPAHIWRYLFHKRSRYDELKDFMQWSEEKHFFCLFTLLLPFFIMICIRFYLTIPMEQMGEVTCPLRLMNGMYCPFCGGTRAFLALLHGQIFKSLYYHPLPLILILEFVPWYGSNLLHYISVRHTDRPCIPGLRCRLFYVLIPILVTLIYFLVRNFFLLYMGKALL